LWWGGGFSPERNDDVPETIKEVAMAARKKAGKSKAKKKASSKKKGSKKKK